MPNDEALRQIVELQGGAITDEELARLSRDVERHYVDGFLDQPPPNGK